MSKLSSYWPGSTATPTHTGYNIQTKVCSDPFTVMDIAQHAGTQVFKNSDEVLSPFKLGQ